MPALVWAWSISYHFGAALAVTIKTMVVTARMLSGISNRAIVSPHSACNCWTISRSTTSRVTSAACPETVDGQNARCKRSILEGTGDVYCDVPVEYDPEEQKEILYSVATGYVLEKRARNCTSVCKCVQGVRPSTAWCLGLVLHFHW
eukprot:scpid75853/ scgid35020/ 